MESLHRRSFPADPFSFIRIIVSDDINSARIKIPEKFTEKHGANLPETVTLKVPNGDIWQVDLIDLKGAIWFNNGWMEFAEHYKLRFGHLLMFKYEGFSNFRVHLYDPNGCEMVYPKNRNHQLAHDSTEIKATSSLDSCVKADLDDSEATKSDREACSSWGQDQEAAIKIDGVGEGEAEGEAEGEGEGEAEAEAEGSNIRVDRYGRKRALDAAKASFTSDKPFFMAYITQHHIVGRANVRVPLSFVKEHWSGLKKAEKCVLRLGIDKRYKRWEVDLCGLTLRMAGWKIFMKDNNVSEDDICAFELINPHENMLKVSIIRS